MDFTEALSLLRDGKRVRLALWRECGGRVGSWLELATTAPAGFPLRTPVFLIWREDDQVYMPWSGAQNDILRDDWELA